jgi:hypothetical protein
VGLNVANGIVLKTCAAICGPLSVPACGDPCSIGDLSFLADVSGTHLVVDVVGYFSAAKQPSGVQEGSVGLTTLTAACQAFTSCTVVNATNSTRPVLAIGNVLVVFEHSAASTDLARFNVSETSATCDDGDFEPRARPSSSGSTCRRTALRPIF